MDKKLEKKIRFRNYKPHDDSLQKQCVETTSIRECVQNSIEKCLSEFTGDVNEINIVPNKSNWDLKSQAASKIAKLEKKTHRAIVQILQESLGDEIA